VPLALCGAVVFLARGLSPRSLLGLGMASFAIGSLLTLTLMWSLIQGPPAALEAWKDRYTPRRVNMVAEIIQYQGSWTDQMRYRVPEAWEVHTSYFVTRLFWQMSGLM